MVDCRTANAFTDEFNSNRIGQWNDPTAKWAPFFVTWGVRHLAGNNDQAIKIASFENLSNNQPASTALGTRKPHEVSNGTLKLRGYQLAEAERPLFYGFPYVAGMISGEMSHSRIYGRWTVKFRINRIGKGHHFSLWMLAKDGSYPPEIDFIEIVGHEPGRFYSNSHGEPGDLPLTFKDTTAGAWHVVTFTWTSSEMVWRLDGGVVRRQPNYVTDKAMYFLATWEIGSNWPGPTDASTPWPAEAEISYVRIANL
jgi:beta-glucanase (GH16 family)